MKRFLFIISFATALLTSCVSDIFNEPDPADAFVGTYSVSLTQHVVWGSDSGTLSDNGTLHIGKLGATKVALSGFIFTTGEIVGSQIYLQGTNSSDALWGNISTTYGVGTLSGNVLTFTANESGQLAATSGGYKYPYRSTDYYTAIKQ